MKRKNLLLIILLLSISSLCKSQSITSAKFVLYNMDKEIRSIELTLDNHTVIEMNSNGDISYINGHRENGTPSYIDNLSIKYYSSFDIHDVQHGIKSIGDIQIKHNNAFDIHEEFGLIKSIGDLKIQHNNAFDIMGRKGEVKSIDGISLDSFNMTKSIKGETTEICVDYCK